VLARSSDVSALPTPVWPPDSKHGYLPAGDTASLAATRIVGGGQTATISFSTAGLEPGAITPSFSYPGHTS